MWFTGASWWTLMVAGLLMVGAFWFAAHQEDQKKRQDVQRRYIEALRRIHDERKP